MSCRRVEKRDEDTEKGEWVCTFLLRPEGRGFPRSLVNNEEASAVAGVGFRFSLKNPEESTDRGTVPEAFHP